MTATVYPNLHVLKFVNTSSYCHLNFASIFIQINYSSLKMRLMNNIGQLQLNYTCNAIICNAKKKKK